MRQILVSLLVVLGLTGSAYAQGYVRLQPDRTSGTISSTTGATSEVILTSQRVGGFGQVKVQTLDSFTGDLEVQCSADGTNFDADSELTLKKVDASSTVTVITDTVGIWDVTNAGGCVAIKVKAVGGFSGSDTVVLLSAVQSGGGGGASSGGGGGGDFDITTFQTTFGTNAIFLGTGADNVANTQDHLAMFPYTFDGSTWDRWTGAVTQGGAWTVQPGNTQNTTAWLVSLTDEGVQADLDESLNNIETYLLALYNSGIQANNRLAVDIATVGGNPLTAGECAAESDSNGPETLRPCVMLAVASTSGQVIITGDASNGLDVDVTRLSALVAGDADIGNVDLEFGGSAAAVNIGAASSVTLRTVPASISLLLKSLDLDESEEEADDDSGEMCSVWVTNVATTTRFLHFWNLDADDVTVGTTASTFTIGIPGTTSDDVSGMLGLHNGCYAYSTALTLAATTTLTGADAPGANEVIVSVFGR